MDFYRLFVSASCVVFGGAVIYRSFSTRLSSNVLLLGIALLLFGAYRLYLFFKAFRRKGT